MLRDSEKTFCPYDLTLDEKRSLLSGSILSIEAYAGKIISPFLKERFEEAMPNSPCHDAYLTQEEKKEGSRTSEPSRFDW